jgi:PST family polysaccharide transporter
MSLRRRATNALLWGLIQRWSQDLWTAVVFVVLARLLPPDAIGLVAYATVVIRLLQVVSSLGFPQAIVQREELERHHLEAAFWSGLLLAVGLSAAVIGGADVVARGLGEERLAPFLRWLTAGLVLEALCGVQRALLRRALEMRVIAQRTFVANGVGGVVGMGMAVAGFGAWSLVGQQLVAAATGVIVLWTACDWRPRLGVSLAHGRSMLGFGLGMSGGTLLHFATERADRLLVGHILGTGALGVYVVGFRAVETAIGLISGPLTAVSLPVFSRIQADRPRLLAAYRQASEVNAFVAFPAFIGLAVVAEDLVHVVFGAQWSESVPVMQLLGVYGLGVAARFISGPVILAMGRTGWIFFGNLSAAIFTVIGVLLAASHGLPWVAAVLAARSLLLIPYSFAALTRSIDADLGDVLRPLHGPLLGCAVMGAAVLGVQALLPDGLDARVQLLLCISLGVVVYLGVLRLAAPALVERVRGLGWDALPDPVQDRLPGGR